MEKDPSEMIWRKMAPEKDLGVVDRLWLNVERENCAGNIGEEKLA
jgi:hypothetical protein